MELTVSLFFFIASMAAAMAPAPANVVA